MAVTANHIRELMALGVSGDTLLRVIEIIDEASLLTSRDGRDAKAKAALRARAYRDRKRDGRNVTSNGDGVTPPPPSSFSPIPSHITTPPTSLRSVSPERERVTATWPQDAFDLFWKAYPLKVGRKAAFKALNAIRLRGEVEFQKLLDSAGRYAVAADPNFTAHATTWLNRGSWDDEIRTRSTTNGQTTKPGGSLIAALDRALEQSVAEDADFAATAHPLLSFSGGSV